MKRPVIAIGMDSADPQLIENWISEGHLPNFKNVREQGAYGRIKNTVNYAGNLADMESTEVLWPTFLTGCRAHTTGNWDINHYDSNDYSVSNNPVDSGHDYQAYRPFYTFLGEQYRVAVFDVPYTVLSDQVNGVQILGWGGTYPYTVSASNPPELLPEIIEKHGENPILFNDNGVWWDQDYIEWDKQALKESISGRSAICRELLRRDSWDLFLTTFNETHTAGHDLYNRSQPDHPLYPYLNKGEPDPLLEVYQAIDQAIGEILAEVPENAYVCLFSPHGIGPDYTDMPTMVFLPELLYRFSFPGKVAIAPGKVGTKPPSMITRPIRNSWPGEVWSKVYEPNPLKRLWKTWTHKRFLRNSQHGLLSYYALTDPPVERELDLSWMPVMWYSDLWPQMKAFALPTYAHGHIRINLKGRERHGIVEVAEYESLCDELTEILYDLKDARMGKAMVKQVCRTRHSALDNRPKLPDADLIVVWQDCLSDVVDSSQLGRIGPLTHFRAGSHLNRGFVMVKGPGIVPGSDLPVSDTVDLPATILDLMGATIPDYFEGQPLLKAAIASV